MPKSDFMPWVAGGGVVAVGLAARFAIGSVYREAEAADLISTLSQTGLYLGSAIATASATTLALMLTLLGLTNQSESEFEHSVYGTISKVASFATAGLIGSVLLLLLLVMPVGEFEKMPDRWYPVMYNVLFVLTVGVCALLVATVSQLFLTIRYVISRVTPGEDVTE